MSFRRQMKPKLAQPQMNAPTLLTVFTRLSVPKILSKKSPSYNIRRVVKRMGHLVTFTAEYQFILLLCCATERATRSTQAALAKSEPSKANRYNIKNRKLKSTI